MDEQVGLVHDLEGAAESLHQLVRQFAHEAHRVRYEHGLAAREREAPCARVEGGEEPLVRNDAGARQRIEERRLPGVGVADERN